ncbi:hypothetical protein Pfo_004472 [Paulownia fortunei]|nr:hypothetical protein Pfo_004472 [Paulownia fortunei]
MSTENKEGNSDLKQPGSHGRKVPSHGHWLEFKVTKEKALGAIEGHVLGEAVFVIKF